MLTNTFLSFNVNNLVESQTFSRENLKIVIVVNFYLLLLKEKGCFKFYLKMKKKRNNKICSQHLYLCYQNSWQYRLCKICGNMLHKICV